METSLGTHFDAYPRRTRVMMYLVRHVLYGTLTLEGADHIAEARDHGAIIACSHRTDQDMVAAGCALMPHVSMSVATMSVNFQRPLERNFLRLLGDTDTVLPISYHRRDDGRAVPHRLDPRDYARMCRVLDEGRSIFVAAHNPSRDINLPVRAGKAAAYLALRSGAPIIPTSVEFSPSSRAIGRTTVRALGRALVVPPDVRVACGEPFTLDITPSRRITRGDDELRFGDLRNLRLGGEEILSRIHSLSQHTDNIF